MPATQYTEAAARQFLEELSDSVRAIPGVERVTMASTLPMAGQNEITTARIDGASEVPDGVAVHMVDQEYGGAFRIPLTRGRFLTRDDNEASRRVIVINERMATQYWPDDDPIGHRLNLGLGDWADPGGEAEIVGIVGDVQYQSPDSAIMNDVYLSYKQRTSNSNYVAVETQLDSDSVVPLIRAEVNRLNSRLPIFGATTVDAIVARATSRTRLSSILLSIFAGLALTIAAIGIYGMLAYTVTARTRELGVRIALGADRLHIARTVAGQGLLPSLVGLAIGIMASFGTNALLAGFLYRVDPNDSGNLMTVSILLLLLVAVLACYFPYRRACRIDPVTALRRE